MTKNMYNLTYHEHFIDDDGYPNEKTKTVKVNKEKKEWYLANDGKVLLDGSVFHIWKIEKNEV